MSDDVKAAVGEAIDALTDELTDIAHQIHAKPELAFHEHFAAGLLCDTLERHGLQVERGAFDLETSFRCDIGSSGPVVAILSEYDALPQIGHACGHNLMAAMGLGAVLGLSKVGALDGTVRYLGTPAEEYGGGKAVMIDRGAFEGVDAAMLVHPAAADLEVMPTIAMRAVKATFHGKPAHAAVAPETGINALDACVSAYQNIAQLRQHIGLYERIHSIITHGGDAANVVPERAELEVYTRAANATELAALVTRVAACIEAGAIGAGATVDLDWWEHPYMELKSNAPLEAAYKANAESLGRWFVPLDLIPKGLAGSSDMGNVSHVVPTIHPTIGVDSAGVGPHTAEFALCAHSAGGDKALVDAAKSMAMTTIDFLTNEELRAAVAKR